MLQVSVRWVKRFNSLQTGRRSQSPLSVLSTRGNISGFNSLQTGRRSQRCNNPFSPSFWTAFQFPSNGNADTKKGYRWVRWCGRQVSIPFKRERGYKDKTVSTSTTFFRMSFNSLQTGRRIQRLARQGIVSVLKSFNSLQTGRRIQRSHGGKPKKNDMSSFNSLQTGRRIQSGFSVLAL